MGVYVVQTTSERLSGVWWMVSEVSEAKRRCEELTDLWAETARTRRPNRANVAAVSLANLRTRELSHSKGGSGKARDMK
jgi:hypothetical protein